MTGEKAGDQGDSPPRDANRALLQGMLTGQRKQDHRKEGREASIWKKQAGAVVATREDGREGRFRMMMRWDFLLSVGPGDLELEGGQGPPVEWPQETAAKLSSLSGF